VAAGDQVGTAADTVHFGARAGTAYLDPEVLLGTGAARVRLVPDVPPKAASEAAERNGVAVLVGWLGRAGRAGASAAAEGVGGASHLGVATGAQAITWARAGGAVAQDYVAAQLAEKLDVLLLVAHYARYATLAGSIDTALIPLRAALEWRRDQARCTPAAVPPPRLHPRHLVVEVAGLGSRQAAHQADRTKGGAVFAVDTDAVGWAKDDVYRFSYRGGTTSERGYTAADTQVDIRVAGRRLRELLERLQRQQPGVPIDIVAHSQGGLVARSALGTELDFNDPRTPRIASVTTFGTPHHGANLATAGALLGHSTVGGLVERGAGRAGVGGTDPTSVAVRQLSETSAFIRELNERPLPTGVRFTSIAARGDPVVPSPRAHLDGATNVIVDVPGVGSDHDVLPRSSVARRELALAVNGMGPTCQSLFGALQDAAYGEAISRTEDAVGATAGALAHRADRGLPMPTFAERTHK
jgi:hypothetical protein